MIGLIDVFESVNDTLKAYFKDIKVYKERIRSIDKPILSLELISFKTNNHSKYIIEKSLDLDIIYFSPNNRIDEALAVADRLMSAFSMGLYVRVYNKMGQMIEKRFLHVLKPAEYKLIDDDLHFLVRFDFADGLNPVYMTDVEKVEEINEKDRPNKDRLIDNPDRYKEATKEENKDYIEDIEFVSKEEEKAYRQEDLKLMQSLSINYEIMEV